MTTPHSALTEAEALALSLAEEMFDVDIWATRSNRGLARLLRSLERCVRDGTLREAITDQLENDGGT